MENNLINLETTHTLQVPETAQPGRLDILLVSMMPHYSRNFFQHLIKEGYIEVNDKKTIKTCLAVKPGDTIAINLPPKRNVAPDIVVDMVKSKNLAIEVIFEHEHFLIVYKPANIMVHAPSERSTAVTLVDWLLVYYPDVAQTGYSDRPGIVHRIDKDTSGLLVIPRTPYAHKIFSKLFKDREIHKTYLAFVEGHPERTGTINIPIGRSAKGNIMAAFPEYTSQVPHDAPAKPCKGKPAMRYAITHYTVKEYFEEYSLIEATIVTGRTHQIRVHFTAIGHSIVGDPVYGNKSKLIKRQALHAYNLSFIFDGDQYNFSKEVPEDFQALLDACKKI